MSGPSEVPMEVGYFRRWYGNLTTTDNRALMAADFDPFSLTTPAHPDLPGGGGYVIGGLYDVKPEKFSVPSDNYVTFSDSYGKQIQHWNGIDVTVNARVSQRLLFLGGLSTGRTSTDYCEIAAKLPSNVFGNWQQPQGILVARFAKVGVQFEF